MTQREKSSRLDLTLMINHCVIPKGDGGSGYKLCTDNHTFNEWHTEYHDRYGKDIQTGEPRDIYCWRVFGGKYDALDACIAKGVVRQRAGKDLYGDHHGSLC